MYICLECKNLFDTPTVYTETHGLTEPPYESYCGCPLCGGAYQDAIKCESCGDYITDKYYTVGGKKYCGECVEKHEIGEVG